MYIVYGREEHCPFCEKAKELLKEVDGIYVTLTAEQLQDFKQRGFETVPIVFKAIGGYTEMKNDVEQSLKEDLDFTDVTL